MSKFALGIDLDTTFSSVSIAFSGSIDIIADKNSSRAIPSIVKYSIRGDSQKIEVGCYAERRLNTDPRNTIFDTKRMLAAKYDDSKIKIMKSKFLSVINKFFI